MNTNDGGSAFSQLSTGIVLLLVAFSSILAAYMFFQVFKRSGSDAKSADTEATAKEYLNVAMNYGIFLGILAVYQFFGSAIADMFKSFFSIFS
ncbi:MAG: divalent metal cation (Fe/Co/Zn/Cd) transporter [Rhodococcus sp. (in: high G+C Gram-positive bacteria)]|jgi:divalent metal cation (Fe/Co/Zn/Cd) transporter